MCETISNMPAHQTTEINIPNFLAKLWKIVDESEYNQSISWDQSGFSFHILDPKTFSRDVLPMFFKHNNLNSFVRQLNMYGFRKVTPVDKSGLVQSKSDQEHLEFQHAYFVKEHPHMMQYIKRKITATSAAGPTTDRDPAVSGQSVGEILDEVKHLREKQGMMDSKLGQMKKENQTLWREVAHMRSLHLKQQQIVSRLIQFLLSVVQPTGQQANRLAAGKRPLAIGPESSDGMTISVPNDMHGPKKYKLVPVDDEPETREPETPTEQSSESQRKPGIIIADVTDVQPDATADAGYYAAMPPHVTPPMADLNLSLVNQVMERNLESLDTLLASNTELASNTLAQNNAEATPPISPSAYMTSPGPSSDAMMGAARGWSVEEGRPMVRFRQDFGDYLDNVDVDLNYLRELMNEEQSLELSDTGMQNLMSDPQGLATKVHWNTVPLQQQLPSTSATTHPHYSGVQPHFLTEDNPMRQIVGNELTVYQAPQNFATEDGLSRSSAGTLETPVSTPLPSTSPKLLLKGFSSKK